MQFHGLIAGLLSRFGRIGVIIGFCLGNALLTYFANGNTIPIITIREILIASLGLLAIPKNVGFDIESFGTEKLLKEANTRVLEENKMTQEKLNNDLGKDFTLPTSNPMLDTMAICLIDTCSK